MKIKPSLLDRAIASISPQAGYRRLQYKMAINAAYEATKQTRTQKLKRSRKGPNETVNREIVPLREMARHMEENNDVVVSILNTFAVNVIGNGIQVEPQPKTMDGELHEDFAKELLTAWNLFCKKPEVTKQFSLAGAERVKCMSWVRDGEVFSRHLVGNVAGLTHGSEVPYSFQMLEADFCPVDLTRPSDNIYQGIQLDEWGAPVNYAFYADHPGEAGASRSILTVPAETVSHIKNQRRINQVRGLSMLAPVAIRLNDLKEVDDYERIAARIAAAQTIIITKEIPDEIVQTDDEGNREIPISPGMVYDGLRPGEDVKIIDSNRPSPNLQPFRDAMIRAASAGTAVGYSSTSKNYSGTYSAQRQELVEQWAHYTVNTGYFVSRDTMPAYEHFVAAYLMARSRLAEGPIPTDLDLLSVYDADYRGPVMPWIDPEKEVNGKIKEVQAGFKARKQIIRESGDNPATVYDNIVKERTQDYDDGMVFSSDYYNFAQRGDYDNPTETDTNEEMDAQQTEQNDSQEQAA